MIEIAVFLYVCRNAAVLIHGFAETKRSRWHASENFVGHLYTGKFGHGILDSENRAKNRTQEWAAKQEADKWRLTLTENI